MTGNAAFPCITVSTQSFQKTGTYAIVNDGAAHRFKTPDKPNIKKRTAKHPTHAALKGRKPTAMGIAHRPHNTNNHRSTKGPISNQPISPPNEQYPTSSNIIQRYPTPSRHPAQYLCHPFLSFLLNDHLLPLAVAIPAR